MTTAARVSSSLSPSGSPCDPGLACRLVPRFPLRGLGRGPAGQSSATFSRDSRLMGQPGWGAGVGMRGATGPSAGGEAGSLLRLTWPFRGPTCHLEKVPGGGGEAQGGKKEVRTDPSQEGTRTLCAPNTRSLFCRLSPSEASGSWRPPSSGGSAARSAHRGALSSENGRGARYSPGGLPARAWLREAAAASFSQEVVLGVRSGAGEAGAH